MITSRFLQITNPKFVRGFWSKTSKKKFGKYELVEPFPVTKMLKVPENVPRPDYFVSGGTSNAPHEPELKTDIQIERMRKSCRLAARILAQIEKFIQVGKSTNEVDVFAHDLIISSNAYPSPLNYKRFPKSICTSVNNVACHGIPDTRPLADGDIVNVDITVYYDGYHGDCSKTFLIGNVDDIGTALVRATEVCLETGIAECRPGRRFSEIGKAVERKARELGYRVVPCFVGHGIGEYFHGPPDICHFYNAYPGVMESGMTFTIEPVLSQGTQEIEILEDGWTAVTTDGARTAQFEHTVLITSDGVEVLTINE